MGTVLSTWNVSKKIIKSIPTTISPQQLIKKNAIGAGITAAVNSLSFPIGNLHILYIIFHFQNVINGGSRCHAISNYCIGHNNSPGSSTFARSLLQWLLLYKPRFFIKRSFKRLARWWLNQPSWKICSSKWVHLPQIGVTIKKYLSCHHPACEVDEIFWQV